MCRPSTRLTPLPPALSPLPQVAELSGMLAGWEARGKELDTKVKVGGEAGAGKGALVACKDQVGTEEQLRH